MQPQLVIFDCDGVLIDSEFIACTADAEELTDAGFPYSTGEVVRRFSGTTTMEMLATIEAETGRKLPLDLASRIETRVLKAYRETLKPIAMVAQTLSAFPWPYCVASSSKPSKLALGLVETGLFDIVYPHVFSASLVPRGKPAPDVFLFAAERMGAAPGGCVVIEDSVAGVTAAGAAGMRVIGFCGGGHSYPDHAASLSTSGAEVVTDCFDAIPHLILGMPKLCLS